MILKTQNLLKKQVRVVFSLIGLTMAFQSCQPIQSKMEPTIVFTPPSNRLELCSAFNPLTPEERQQEWGKELLIADSFSRELDLYRAITCYKRALVLLPEEEIERKLQIYYDLVLCYYLGNKYNEAIGIFESTELSQVNPLFAGYSNLLLILYDSYKHTNQEDKADCVYEIIEKSSPETAQDLTLYSTIKEGEVDEVQALILCHPRLETMQPSFDTYYQLAKSPKKARLLNAILPGAGYYYLGQKKTARTAFIINALFTAAAYQFFRRGYVAAGAITTSLELGWYFGGINGAGLEAQEYNTRIYEAASKKILIENDLFPLLMFETTF